MPVEPIKIQGLREFQAALKAMDGESQKKLRVVFNEVAEDVAAAARRKVPTRSGRARASVRVLSTQREAKVVGGGRKAPYYPWLDFGGAVGRHKSTRRPFIRDRGRYIYVAYSVSRSAIQEALEKGLTDLAREAGLEVS